MNFEETINEMFEDDVMTEGLSPLGVVNFFKDKIVSLVDSKEKKKIQTVYKGIVKKMKDYYAAREKTLGYQKKVLNDQAGKYRGTKMEALPGYKMIGDMIEQTDKSLEDIAEQKALFDTIKDDAYDIDLSKGDPSLVAELQADREKVQAADKKEADNLDLSDKIASAPVAPAKPETKEGGPAADKSAPDTKSETPTAKDDLDSLVAKFTGSKDEKEKAAISAKINSQGFSDDEIKAAVAKIRKSAPATPVANPAATSPSAPVAKPTETSNTPPTKSNRVPSPFRKMTAETPKGILDLWRKVDPTTKKKIDGILKNNIIGNAKKWVTELVGKYGMKEAVSSEQEMHGKQMMTVGWIKEGLKDSPELLKQFNGVGRTNQTLIARDVLNKALKQTMSEINLKRVPKTSAANKQPTATSDKPLSDEEVDSLLASLGGGSSQKKPTDPQDSTATVADYSTHPQVSQDDIDSVLRDAGQTPGETELRAKADKVKSEISSTDQAAQPEEAPAAEAPAAASTGPAAEVSEPAEEESSVVKPSLQPSEKKKTIDGKEIAYGVKPGKNGSEHFYIGNATIKQTKDGKFSVKKGKSKQSILPDTTSVAEWINDNFKDKALNAKIIKDMNKWASAEPAGNVTKPNNVTQGDFAPKRDQKIAAQAADQPALASEKKPLPPGVSPERMKSDDGAETSIPAPKPTSVNVPTIEGKKLKLSTGTAIEPVEGNYEKFKFNGVEKSRDLVTKSVNDAVRSGKLSKADGDKFQEWLRMVFSSDRPGELPPAEQQEN